MKTIKEFMTQMPHTVGSDTSIEFAQKMMADYNCHHLPVLTGGKLVGILSDRDLELVELSGQIDELTVNDIMNFEPYTVERETPVKRVAEDMLERNISSAIVRADNNSPWGIFTVTDALKFIIQSEL